jgi:glycosyltransferase involved in cell wall biosynthesis
VISHPTVSVLVPTYNGDRFIRRTIESILRQTYPATEIVVVDDGPGESLRATVSEYPDPRILFSKNPRNLGMIRNWNRCIELAGCDLIAFLHDDDFFAPTYLERAVEAFASDDRLGIWACSSKFFDEHERFIGDSIRPVTGAIGSDAYANLVFAMLNVSPPSETVLRASAIAAAGGGYDESFKYAAEADLYLRIAIAGYHAIHTAELLCNRTSWSNQSTVRLMNTATNFRDRFTFLRKWTSKDPGRFNTELRGVAMTNQIKLAYWAIAKQLSGADFGQAKEIALTIHEYAPEHDPRELRNFPTIFSRLAVCLLARALRTEPHRITAWLKGLPA